MVKKLKLSKSKCAPKLLFLIDKRIRKIRMIRDTKKINLKIRFSHFLTNSHELNSQSKYSGFF